VPGAQRVSVCIASFNGAPWVEEQLRSVLEQLGPTDEVVVVDDASTDDTVEVVESLDDPRIRIHRAPVNAGYAEAFATAIEMATGEYILLSDQDDVWPAGRVDSMLRALRGADVVAGNLVLLDTGSALRGPYGRHPWLLPAAPDRHPWRVVAALALSNVPYFSSAMGIRADFRSVVLPFPPSARELPDAWIALLGLLSRSIAHVGEPVVLRRVHGANTSGTVRGPLRVLNGRRLFAQMVIGARARVGAAAATRSGADS
jgi:glycosyltransferase involved in cell wall biosynthesis